jgi:nitroreductase
MKSNPVLEAILARRSIRHYTVQEVEEESVLTILEAGRWAPSGKNGQPWRWVVVRNQEIKRAISRLTRYGSIIAQAPVAIVSFLDNQSSYDRVKDLQAIGACMQNMLLAAHSLGLGASWQGEILNRRKEVEEVLGVPAHYELMAVLTLGYPARSDQKSSRRQLQDLVWIDRYGHPFSREGQHG